MLWPISVQQNYSPSRSATSVTKWKNLKISLQDSMWDWFVILIQEWPIWHPCLTTINSWMNPKSWIRSQTKRLGHTRPRWSHKVFNPKLETLQPLKNIENGLRPLTTLTWPSSLPQTKTATPRISKIVPMRLRNVKTAVRNVARTPHFIIAYMEKIQVTPQESAKSSC